MFKTFFPERILWLLALSAFMQPLFAEDQTLTYDRINLSVSASDEVENDTLVAMLFAQKEGNDAARLAKEVNGDVAWALKLAEEATGIKAQTLDYQTNPIYRNQTLTGWRVRQSLRLESRDAAALSELIGTLQKRLEVGHIGYSVSEERRKQAEDRLIAEALAAFSQRAALIAGQLQRPGYRLVQMDINTGADIYRPQLARAAAMEMSGAAPPLEVGTQAVRITVSGTIELQGK